MKKLKLIILGLMLCVGATNIAFALTFVNKLPPDYTNNHKRLIESADLIISGKVVLIQYEQIKVQYEQAELDNPQGMPTTLVTYQVDQVFHGKIEEDSYIRLRFKDPFISDI